MCTCPVADTSAGSAPVAGSKRKGSTTAEAEDKRPRKGLYFEFAKKKWENEDSFKLPDGECDPTAGGAEASRTSYNA